MFEAQHFELYLRYQDRKHPDGSMRNSSPKDYLDFLSSEWCNTNFVEFHIAKKLVAVAIVDRFDDSLSAVYTFFDTDYANYSLGVYAVLWQIQWASELNLEWVYLGYWIAECKKMSYKNQYQPLQIFQNDSWKKYSEIA
jgi:arginine-tRNA-protein transferase